MTRTPIGLNPWGENQHDDLNGIEALAQAALILAQSDHDIIVGGRLSPNAIQVLVEQLVAANVPPAVAAALANDAGIRAALLAQITALTLNDLGLVRTNNPLFPQWGHGDPVFSIADVKGARSWVEIAADGHPTPHAAQLITQAVQAMVREFVTPSQQAPGIAFAITDAANRIALSILQDGSVSIPKLVVPDGFLSKILPVGVQMSSLPSQSGYQFAITDQNNRVAFGLTAEGKIVGSLVSMPDLTIPPDQYVLSTRGVAPNRQIDIQNTTTGNKKVVTTTGDNFQPRLARDGKAVFFETMQVDGSSKSFYYDTTLAKVWPAITEALKWVGWGDSLTGFGWYESALQTLLGAGAVVLNRGIGGSRTNDIAGRQGGIPVPCTVPGNVIPASTAPINVTCPVRILNGTSTGTVTNNGTLAGVAGVMSRTGADSTAQYTFTPNVAPGAPVACPPSTPFIPDDAIAYQSYSNIIWTGRNNIGVDVDADTLAMTKFIKAYSPRFLVIGVTSSVTETVGTSAYIWIEAQNARLAAAYGDRFVDFRRYLITNADAIFTAQGWGKTANDIACLAGDTIPPTFMNAPGSSLDGRDSLHFRQEIFQAVLAPLLYSRMQQKGWA